MLTNETLVLNLKQLVGDERKILNQILECLAEVDSRKLFLEMAYSSLFEFCTKELGYSESAAYRRIEAVRLLKSLTQEQQENVKHKIQSGQLNLTHLTAAQKFFKQEIKAEKKYSSIQKMEILDKIESKSKIETERELVKISPQFTNQKTESLRVLDETKVELKLLVTSQLVDKLNELKALKSHCNPDNSLVGLIEHLVDQELKKIKKIGSGVSIGLKVDAKSKSEMEFDAGSGIEAELYCNATPLAQVKSAKETEGAGSKEVEMGKIRFKNLKESWDDKNNRENIKTEELKIKMGAPRSRYIPQAVQRQVWAKESSCSFIDIKTGKRCSSNYFLQIDHIQEFAKGGLSHDPKNLRLLCGVHNRNR